MNENSVKHSSDTKNLSICSRTIHPRGPGHALQGLLLVVVIECICAYFVIDMIDVSLQSSLEGSQLKHMLYSMKQWC